MLRGVRAAEKPPGVFHCFWAGLGVMLTKSERSKGCPGVVGKRLPPPGVIIMDEGRARSFFDGGVEGGSMRVRPEGKAGDGDAARYRRRSAPSSPDLLPVVVAILLGRRFRFLLRIGGVRGGDDRLASTRKECMPRISSSSSEGAAKFSDVRSTEGRRVPRKNDTSGPFEVVKCC